MILPPTMLNLDYGQVLQVPLPLDCSHYNSELPSMLHFTKLPLAMAFVLFKQQNPFTITGASLIKYKHFETQSAISHKNLELMKTF